MEKIRQTLKSLEDLELPMSGDFFDQMHDQIMAQVEETVLEPQPALLKPRNFLRAHWRGWLYPAGGTLAFVLALGFFLSSVDLRQKPQVLVLNESGEKLVAAAIRSPSDIGLFSSQTEADFFVDVASQSFENLNISQFNKIMGEDRR